MPRAKTANRKAPRRAPSQKRKSRRSGKTAREPIAIYHEHPRWFLPVFAELDRRAIPYVRLDAAHHHFDLSPNGDQQFGLVFNRMSPSAWTRGNAHAIFYTLSYLAHLERTASRVVNGSHAFRVETSKALQLSLLQSLGLPHPRSVVINHPSEAVAAARDLRFPIVVKPNIGGSGVGIVRFDSPEQLESAVQQWRDPARPRFHRHRAGIHSRARRAHHARRNARLQISLRHQSVHFRRNFRPLPHGHLQNHRRRRNQNRLRGGRREDRPARRRLYARRRKSSPTPRRFSAKRKSKSAAWNTSLTTATASSTTTTSTRSRISFPTARASSASIPSRAWWIIS